MKLTYYLAAIGNPDYNIKLSILKHNLLYLKNQGVKVDIIVNCYDKSFQSTHLDRKMYNKLYIHYKKGVLTELWHSNPYHGKLNDIILFILDDVRLFNFNVKNNLLVKNKYKIDLYSPKIVKATHRFMQIDFPGLVTTNRVEVYCLLLNKTDFFRYLKENPVYNKWLWGVDLIMGYLGFNPGINYTSSAIHVLPSKANRKEAYQLMIRYLKEKKVDGKVLGMPIYKKKILL